MPEEFRPEHERLVALTEEESRRILGIDRSFVSSAGSVYFDNFNLPCPVRVEIVTAAGATHIVVLRRTRHGSVDLEVPALRGLRAVGLPVPDVLAEPFTNERGEREAVYSLVPGESLQKLSTRSGDNLRRAKELLVSAVSRLMDASEAVTGHELSASLPRLTLPAELTALRASGTAWLEEPVFREALAQLEPIFAAIETPLVLTNGDYQPGNFMARDGELTGFLDFESASFQDPLMGFVKYPIYDLRPLSRTDVVDHFLRVRGFSRRSFASRLALGCLKTLKREIPVSGGDENTQRYRARTLALLRSAMAD